jgi:1-acyl-sn-glycerol-3-phosphate acyltransferase
VIVWLRSALFHGLLIGWTGLLGVGALPLAWRTPRAHRAALRLWARGTLALLRACCGISWRLAGTLPPPGAALIAAKHQSAFDTIVWLVLLPDAAYVLKKELLSLPLYGWHARRLGMIVVDRKAGARALRTMVEEADRALASGRQVVIFPEGTRVAPGAQVAYQPGVAAIQARSHVPVTPAATNSGLFWGPRALRKLPGTIVVSVLPPVPPGLARPELMERLRQSIETETNRLVGPVDNSVGS